MSAKKLTTDLKQKLIQQSLRRKYEKVDREADEPLKPLRQSNIPKKFYRFDQHPGYRQMQIIDQGASMLDLESPFFRVHDDIAGATTNIDGREMINFASYNYLGLSGHEKVNQAAIEAIQRYGTSVSASRIMAGERPIHAQLESAIATSYGVDDAVVYVSGHATNVSTIGYLFSDKDLIIHDEYAHNSTIVGAQLSGAKRLSFSHNDMPALEQLLEQHRHLFERVVIIVEGLYGMDGDYPDLPRLIELKKQFHCFLMVDEAHSFGVLGKTGKGLKEIYGIPGPEVDIWMGTLSKSLSGCGGFIAGESALIDNLRYLSPGFLYSAGLPAPTAAAAIASLEIMATEPERITQLHNISTYFLAQAQLAGLNTGVSKGIAIIPVIIGSSVKTTRIAAKLFREGINVQSIVYPGVPENSARLRFFISCDHTKKQVDTTIDILKQLL
ncbi:aminotransferase class I/II-fold pyridoxal phosphate-dependent enzyme [Amphritea japonica]|uniref:8-amino-7-oxononanoate synthase n=1 Tax=Amphritea japonica ATCC BAA-1530 TaxID=1278309 RepID=A0A7R6P7Z0_9GAMM|nr:aminotransferase class I/II-fold pyridoxal phosphate-dependent enzyme [Amphritea japonica]BBB25117.1 8-amino-7-oxononanoate synthase [Amphritea japonica ATCC BAA-1530]